MLKFIPSKSKYPYSSSPGRVPSRYIINKFTELGVTKKLLNTILVTPVGERLSKMGPVEDIDDSTWYNIATAIFWLSYNQKYEKFMRGLAVDEQLSLIRNADFNALISPIYKYNVNNRGLLLC